MFKFIFILLDLELNDKIKNSYNYIDNKINNIFDWINNALAFNFSLPKFNLDPIKSLFKKKQKINKDYELIDCSNTKVTKRLKVTKTINPKTIITDYVETDQNGFEQKWQVVEVTDPRLNIKDETVVVQEFEETTETNSVSFA